MIAKISSTENLGGALGYNFKKVARGEAVVLTASKLYRNGGDGYRMEEVLSDMQTLIPAKCRTKKTVFHCSFNPHPDEKLSDETLIRMAGEYMDALGYKDQPYIVFKHNDIAREHIHIVSVRVDGNGRKINDKFEGRRSKRITDEMERRYGLIPSTKVTENVSVDLQKVDAASGNVREQMAHAVRSVLKHYRFCSLGELNAILSKWNIAVEEVKTEYRGKRYDGLVYVPTDDDGKKSSLPVNASEMGRGVGHSAVQNRMGKSKQSVKPLLPSVRRKVLKAVRECTNATEVELKARLEEQGLRTVIRKNAAGRIYGITFIDDKEGIALNGSRLGKGYSARVFGCYLTEGINPFNDTKLYGSVESNSPQQEVSGNGEQLYDAEPCNEGNLVDDFLSMPSSGNDDWKEAAWQRKLRRLAKPKIRRRK